jgi:cobalt-precorrin 5A hydrolase
MVGQQIMRRTIAIGVGCRVGCAADGIEALVRQALAQVPAGTPRGLFTIADKHREAGLAEAAFRLGLTLVPLSRTALRQQTPFIRTPSAAAERHFGVVSVAEAAALSGAGPGSVLLVERIAGFGATCAIAGPPEGAA